jgi:hypothetical protein
MVFEVAVPRGLEVGGVMVGGVEDEGDTTVPQVMGTAIAVSVGLSLVHFSRAIVVS